MKVFNSHDATELCLVIWYLFLQFIGFGVFTTKRFERGNFLLHYAGDLLTLSEAKKGRKNIIEKGKEVTCTTSIMMAYSTGE